MRRDGASPAIAQMCEKFAANNCKLVGICRRARTDGAFALASEMISKNAPPRRRVNTRPIRNGTEWEEGQEGRQGPRHLGRALQIGPPNG